MRLRSICHSLRRFYFNYHHIESSSLYLYSSFTRRLQFALRLVITFLVSGFIGYGTPLRDYFDQIYMIPNLSVLCIQDTVGSTLYLTLHVTSAIVPLSIFLYIVQKIGLSYQQYVAGELLLLVSSFFISYQSRKLQSRKLVLWFNAIFFATIINDQSVRPTFVFELLGDFLLGMFTCLIVSILVFPLFATLDIENRVHYCLFHLNQMQTYILQAFLCQDQIAAGVSLARATIVERRVRETMNKMRDRLSEARFEPSRLLQWIFHRKQKHIMNLTIEQQADLITSLVFHVCSLQSMVKQCSFNEYHNDLIDQLETNFSELIECQLVVIKVLLAPGSVTHELFQNHLNKLRSTLDSLNSAYRRVRLHHIEDVIQSGVTLQSEDHLSHAFFFFQLGAIVRQLTQTTAIDSTGTKSKKSFKDTFKSQFDWSRIISAFISMFIMGVGSVFVMVPTLANTFANGQWILIALCNTQGDTVGGAFISMRMRLVGTLLGSMWAYTIYATVGGDVYKIFGMLAPWFLIFGYLFLNPQWNNTATIAASTPIVVNLGRLYGNVNPQGNYALLRIEDTIIGVALGAVLTIFTFPVFAVDLLKSNIQDTLKLCRHAAESIHFVYDQFFHHQHERRASITINQEEEIKLNIDLQSRQFHELISSQRTLVDYAALEPSIWWFNYGFSANRYSILVQEQLDMFRMLHNTYATFVHMKECSKNDLQQFQDLRLHAAGGRFLPDLHTEFANLGRQVSDCVDLWISYFTLTQTTSYRWSRIPIWHKKQNLIKGDLSENQQCLIELHRTVLRLQEQHQQAMNYLSDFYREKSRQGEELSTLVPYVNSDQAEAIFVAITAMYYSTIQLAQAVMALGTTIHTVFELETTSVYRYF